MKKFLSIICVLFLGMSFAACQNSTKTSENNTKSSTESTKVENESPEKEEENLETPADDEMEEGENMEDNTEEMGNLWEYGDIDTTISLEEKTQFNGNFFLVEYPSAFMAFPEEPSTEFNGTTIVQTDEAWFTSPDSLVEFYVYSPQWGGDPDFVEVQEGETLVSEKVETEQTEMGERVTRWFTISSEEGEYVRSYVSIKEMDGTVHKIYGISYATQEAYDYYKSAYEAFKNSLQQFSD